MRITFLVSVVAGLCVAAHAHAETPAPRLKHNPFSQPNLVVSEPAREAVLAVTRFTGMLQATLVSGEYSLVNVDGNLVGIGDRYKGYRLLEVGEGTATFANEDSSVTLTVGEDGVDEDED